MNTNIFRTSHRFPYNYHAGRHNKANTKEQYIMSPCPWNTDT